MAITTIYTYPLNGTQRDFTIPFEYLARRFVVLTIIGTDRKELILTTDYRFTSKTNVQTNVPWGPADGYERIEIRRNTSATDRLVDFADGSILRASELNTSQVQTLHVAEEARNMVADTISENSDGDLDARGRRLVNLADAIEPDHAVTLRQEQAFAQSTLGNRNASEAAAALSVASKEAAQVAQGVSSAQAALSTTKAAESEASAVRSETAAGTIGNNVTLAEQARAGAEAARDTTVAAAQSVQGVNIPSAMGNALKWLRQKANESGFEYVEAYTKQAIDSLLSTINSSIATLQSGLSALTGQVAALPFTKSYTSPQQVFTPAGLLTLTHGLGAAPRLVTASLVCQVAELDYSVGDEVQYPVFGTDTSSGTGLSTVADATNLTVRIGSGSLIILNKATGVTTFFTAANWRLVIRAWA